MIRRSLLCIRSKSHDQWWKKKISFGPSRTERGIHRYLHTTSRSFLVAIFERGIEGTRRRFGRDAWPIIIITGIDGAQLGRAKDRAARRCVVTLPPLLHTNPIFILACRVSIINTTTALLHTRAITQATDAGRIILPASLRFVLIGRPYLYILQLEENGYWTLDSFG